MTLAPYDSRRWQTLCDQTVPGKEREALGEWWLRADLGETGRANSAWPIGSASLPVAEALDVVERWYRDRDLVPMIQVYDGTDATVTAELDRRGWRTGRDADILARDLSSSPLFGSGPGAAAVKIAITSTPSSGFVSLTGNDARIAEMCRTEGPRFFATATDSDSEPVGCGLGIRADDAIGIFAMRTSESARRRGIARQLLDYLCQAGRDDGAAVAFLQVMEANHAAQALYASAGFHKVERYVYRAP